MPDSSAKQAVKKFDIFSLPFQFSLGNNEKEKRTFVGGLLSMLILILSGAYLVYLCYLYFGNLIQPSIATTNEYSLETFPMEFTQNFVAVKITLFNGQTLQEFEKSKGKTYLNMISVYDTNGRSAQLKPNMMIDCQDEDLQGYYCLDMKSLNKGQDSITLNFTPNNIEKESLSILFSICDQTIVPPSIICESEAVIRQTLINLGTNINIRVSLKQFNTKTKVFQDRVKEESYYFDSNMAFYSKFNFQKTDLGISEGFLIQQIDDYRYFSDFFRKDMSVTQSYIKSQLGFNILGGALLFIGQESISLEIQYAQFTTLLAQFSSVFNSLLFIGVISKFFAQSEILQQFAELQLKVYFKKSALLILEEIGFKNSLKEANKGGILNLWNYVKKMDIKNVGSHIKLGLFKKLHLMINSDDVQKEKEDSAQLKVYKQLIAQSNKAFNIFEIQREILQLKIMIRLLLSVEQFAAMQLCGSRLIEVLEKPPTNQVKEQNGVNLEESSKIKSKDFLSFSQVRQKNSRSSSIYPLQMIQQQQQQQQEQDQLEGIEQDQLEGQEQQGEKQISIKEDETTIEQQLSHLEKMDLIEKDDQLFQNYLEKFLQHSPQTSEIDKRIKECMVSLNDDTDNVNIQRL